ncbi:MAG TPA: FKBP-type peptidyl-prolyl cis-trans isomerase [Steroidobacteraceae bacterium]|nr:FKBP-type peptidyl-prolyl cis-trans isomerase [Steroidobacteraceae bacterium]
MAPPALAAAPAAAGGTAGASAARSTASAHAAGASDTAALHALGVLLERQLGDFQLTESEFRAVAQGFADGYRHPAEAKSASAYVPQLKALESSRMLAASQREERAGQRFLDRVASLPRAHKTASGMVYLPIVEGAGASPKNGDMVTVQYTGRLIDGSVFDSSAQHGGSATFALGRIIPCWTEGLQLMKVGGRARLVCPASLAYGERGAGGVIKPGATLDFEVRLLAVRAGPPLPTLPAPPRVPGGGAAAIPH